MRLVIDTNAFTADLALRGNAFQVLTGGLERLSHELVVPSVVLTEAINKHSQAVTKLRLDIERVAKDHRRIIRHMCPVIDIDPEKERSAYEAHLRGWIETQNGGRIAPHPKVTHEELVIRATQYRKPFAQSGKGYRDALIWHTILELAKEKGDTPIYFVTNNKDDFGTGPAVDDELRPDLEAIGFPLDLFRLYPTIDDLNKEHVIPTLKPLDEMLAKLQSDTFEGFSLPEFIKSEYFAGYLRVEEMPLLGQTGPLGLGGETTINDVEKIHALTVNDVRVLPPKAYLILATVDADIGLGLFAYDDDWEGFETVAKYFPESGGQEWMEAYEVVRMTLRFTLVLHQDTLTVLSCEANTIESEYGTASLSRHGETALSPRRRPGAGGRPYAYRNSRR